MYAILGALADRIRAMAKAKKKNTSGTTWTDADYAAHGYVTVKLRLPGPAAEAFQAAADRMGVGRAAAVELWAAKELKKAK